MKNIHRALPLALVVVLGAGMAAPRAESQVSVQFRFGTPDRPLPGRQYRQMRALAQYLDEEAWEASNAANETVNYSRRSQDFLRSVTDFSNRASQFAERMATYQTRRWDIPREIVILEQLANRVNVTIRRTRTYYQVADEWRNVLDALARMKQVLGGYDVVIPPRNRSWGGTREYGITLGGVLGGVIGRDDDRRDDRRDDRDRRDREAADYAPGYGAGPLRGGEVEEFRNLARELDQTMARALENMQRYDRGSPLLDDMARLNDGVSSMWQNVDQEQIDPRQWGPTVQSYLNDARTLDQGLQRTNRTQGALPDLQRSIQILDRMADLLR